MSMKHSEEGNVDEDIEAEKRKISELFREIKTKGSNEESKLNWMYKNPSEVVDREEYLLGRSVDKAFDAGTSNNVELSNFPKRVVCAENQSQSGQVDLQRKIHEDPLFAIRQKELDARKQLLNNPLRVKELKKLLEIEAKKKLKAEKKRKKEEKKKNRENKINMLLIKELKKLGGQIDFKMLLEDFSGSSENEEEPVSRIEKKKKRLTSRNSFANVKGKHRQVKKKRTEESSDSELSSNEKSKISKSDKKHSNTKEKPSRQKHKNKHKSTSKRKSRSNNKRKKKTSDDSTNSNSDTDSDSTDTESDSSSDGKSFKKTKRRRLSSAEDISSSESTEDEKIKKRKIVKKRINSKTKESVNSCYKDDFKSSREKHKSSRPRSGSGHQSSYDKESQERSKSSKYGLSTADGSKPDLKEKAIIPYKKKEEIKHTVIKRKPTVFTEKENAAQLKEMMENAKWRKKEREADFSNYKKEKLNEEKIADYKESFMKDQLSKLTKHNSMADRIKSNVNNIQRSASSMDKSFLRK